ncbi:MAG: Nre family DNA repair protein [Desulfurococcaceae archaeon]
MSNRLVFNGSMCITCRGKGLCGLAYCPVIAKAKASLRLRNVALSNVIEGSSPPSLFVGRIGYPYVRAGPSTPPLIGDTAIFDYPENWLGKRIEEILEYRWLLVTGFRVVDVRKPSDKVLDESRLIALSSRPVDVVIVLNKPPKPTISLNDHEPPQGPRSMLENLRILSNPVIPRPVDRVYNDVDLPASDAVVYLYEHGISVSHIQKILSMGGLGVKGQRRLVPTRWSITAVDSVLCKHLAKEIKRYSVINEIMVFEKKIHDNLFIAILYPAKWSYEWLEAWWPGSIWNPGQGDVVVEGDYEDYFGRTTYPGIGGCYYASMLATLEYLRGAKRQASAILMREIYPGFNIPIGVWFVRESCRAMFKSGPVLRTNDLREVYEFLDKETRLGAGKWFSSSRLIQRIAWTRRIGEYFKPRGP